MNNNQRILVDIEKNSFEIIRVSYVEYQRKKYLDLRLWKVGNKGGNRVEIPTTKGIRIHIELLSDLLQALEQAKDLIWKSFDKSSNKKN